MTQYQFRGKRKDSGEWVYGCYVSTSPDEAFILIGVTGHIKRDDYECYMVEVIPETVGMWTGLKDKKDKDIYEGDIIKFHYFYQSLGENLGVQESEHELIGVVKRGAFGWSISAIEGQHWEGYTGYKSGEGESYIVDLYAMNESSIHEESFEVIGNIHDHPHLLTPSQKGDVLNTMNNLDPNTQAAPANQEAAEQATTDQVAAVEQEAQEQAMESEG